MRRTGKALRRIADRIDRAHAYRHAGYSFTFDRGVGFVVNAEGRGCPLMYESSTYERAHAEAIPPNPAAVARAASVEKLRHARVLHVKSAEGRSVSPASRAAAAAALRSVEHREPWEDPYDPADPHFLKGRFGPYRRPGES